MDEATEVLREHVCADGERAPMRSFGERRVYGPGEGEQVIPVVYESERAAMRRADAGEAPVMVERPAGDGRTLLARVRVVHTYDEKQTAHVENLSRLLAQLQRDAYRARELGAGAGDPLLDAFSEIEQSLSRARVQAQIISRNEVDRPIILPRRGAR